MNILQKSVLPIWFFTLLSAILVGFYSVSSSYLVYFPAILGSAIVITFAVQLAMKQAQGFLDRVVASVVGSVVILIAATVVLSL